MKTITAKNFQLNHAQVLRDVRNGQSFQVTFHRLPIAKLTPTQPAITKKPKRGSYAAFLESLKYTAPARTIPPDADLDEIRWQHMQEKYGKYER